MLLYFVCKLVVSDKEYRQSSILLKSIIVETNHPTEIRKTTLLNLEKMISIMIMISITWLLTQ